MKTRCKQWKPSPKDGLKRTGDTYELDRLARYYSEWDSIISKLVVSGPMPRKEWILEISKTTD